MSVILPGHALPVPSFARAAALSRPAAAEQGIGLGEARIVDGVPVQSLTMAALVDAIVAMTRTTGVDVLVGVNAHVVNLARHDATLRRFLATTTMNYADGQSVVWATRLLGAALPERVATTDLAAPLLAAAARDRLPVYFFGARPGVAAAAAERMAQELPGLAIRTSHGYIPDEESDALIRDIREHGTRILFVGLGDPVQERWVERHRDQLPPVVLTCGGLFDWLSGTHRRAPQWMIRAGLEWLWRLGLEPRRLARRYLAGNPAFVAAVVRQRLAEASRRPTRIAHHRAA
ncbi:MULTISPECIES: WecB/TagA/CpsF family glycosyltransferase [Microbacterium]|uniref:WecB/TagA/CpsF family glycosyltransferase n=1 Tax=Microbacterium barkeri TaxID=33917 RepID=UPI00285ACBF0|nr:WecB/TagA/CpsF family glycosyltransferase [Microbacterium barkeri]MDR6878031.1 N-acetylglucosaminyldiphosphoundecaprenol N-acetyl-beta-D-mannosaminyltransferase [Microbacterium barkeri]